ncbi:DinB family protein [Ancylomarina longa]|uniref:DinB family protein n=2 Tax=Ancylomarina longa TaxID=2487017 RepID=A0A434AF43_9BACT|nr:DinB family protein [Ancylomarina longa]
MQITNTTKEIIRQLIDFCELLNDEQYTESLALLMDNSIGKHIRHIIEFYDVLRKHEKNNDTVSYDLREHCEEIERDKNIAVKRLNIIKNWIGVLSLNKSLKLSISFNPNDTNSIIIDTNMKRELVYNIEHAIHHMAIIRIAIEKEYSSIKLNKNFGVAYSTRKYRNDLCAH